MNQEHIEKVIDELPPLHCNECIYKNNCLSVDSENCQRQKEIAGRICQIFEPETKPDGLLSDEFLGRSK